MSQEPIPQPSQPRPHHRWLVIAIGVYSAVLVSFLNVVILNTEAPAFPHACVTYAGSRL